MRWPFKGLILFALAPVLAPSLVSAGCIRPFPNRNQIPPARIFLELSGVSPCALDPGQIEVSSFSQLSNTYRDKTGGDSYLILDHQRSAHRLSLGLGVGWNSDLTLTLSHLRDSAGHTDNLINQFHEAFGRPDGGRSQREDNRYVYTQFNARTGRMITLDHPEGGAGDTELAFRREQGGFDGWIFRESRWGWRLAAKFPTARDSPALGSGGMDFGCGLMGESLLANPWHPFRIYLNLGVVHLADTQALVFKTRPWVPMGTIGAATPLTTRLVLAIQFQVATSRLASSEIEILDEPQNILAVGIHYLWNSWWLQSGFTEDPNTTSEDISLFFSLGWRPDGA